MSPMIDYNGEQVELLAYGRGGSRLIRRKGEKKGKWVAPDYEKMNRRRASGRSMGISPRTPRIS